jgi:hypothetical protein
LKTVSDEPSVFFVAAGQPLVIRCDLTRDVAAAVTVEAGDVIPNFHFVDHAEELARPRSAASFLLFWVLLCIELQEIFLRYDWRQFAQSVSAERNEAFMQEIVNVLGE